MCLPEGGGDISVSWFESWFAVELDEGLKYEAFEKPVPLQYSIAQIAEGLTLMRALHQDIQTFLSYGVSV